MQILFVIQTFTAAILLFSTVIDGQQKPIQWSSGFSDAAQMLLAAIDPTADPCQDFYQYACGNWMKRHPIPTGASQISTFGLLSQAATNNVSLALGAINPFSNDTNIPNAVKIAAKAYQSCQNSSNNQYPNGKAIVNAITSFQINGWPMIQPNWTFPTVSVEELVAHLDAYYKLPTLLSSMVGVDWKNTQSNALYIDQGTLALGSRQYYINQKFTATIASYQRYIVTVSKLLRTDINSATTDAQILADAASLVAYETKLARKMTAMNERRNFGAMFNIFSYADLSGRWPNLNWQDYYQTLLANHNPAYLQTLGSRFNMMEPGYIDQLHSDILTYPTKRTVFNYVVWRFVMQNTQFLGGNYRKAYEDFRSEVDFNVDSLPPSSQSCATLVVRYMPYAAGNVYITSFFQKQSRNEIGLMVGNILAAFGEMLGGLNWLDESSKYQAQKKRSAVIQNIAYSDWIMEKTQLDTYYQGIISTLQSTTDYWTVLAMLRLHFQKRKFLTLGAPPDRHDFQASPALVNAWYEPTLNSITFPAAILNAPFYRSDFPKAVVYGAIGMVMGHELTHGFDDEGSQFNWNGTLAPWMSPSSGVGFETMAQCVVSEYNQFCYPEYQDSCINGVSTQGENIADNGGLKATYNAYKVWTALNGVEPSLPGMRKYTMDQIFFLSYGHVWCRNAKASAITSQLLLDVHSPARYRINGVVRNLDAFGVAFNCPRKSPMFPPESEQCHVYRSTPANPPQPQPSNLPPPTVPTPTQGWIDAANALKEGLNTSVNPCQDFFQFSCGTWIANNPIPTHQSSISSFGVLQTKIINTMIDNIQSINTSNPAVPRTLVAAKNMYQSCVQSADANYPNAFPLLNVLQSFRSGGLPMITQNWTSPPSTYNPWMELATIESYFMTPTLLYSSVTADWKNVSQSAIYIDQGTLGLGDRQYYINPFFAPNIASYKTLMTQVVTLLAKDNHASISPSQIQQDVQDMINFESKLAGFMKPGSERRNYQAMFNAFTSQQIIQRWPWIDWFTYIYTLTSLHIPNYLMTDRFIVMEPSYLDNLHGELKTTSLRTFVNYAGWRFVLDNLEFLAPGYRKALLEFRNAKEMVTSLPPSTSSCASLLLYYMPFASGRLFVGPQQGGGLDKARADVAYQTRNVIDGFTQMLQELQWMDGQSKQLAIDKISSLVQNIDYPDWILDNAQLDTYHQGYISSITQSAGKSFFANYRMLRMKYSQKDYQRLLQRPNRSFFLMSPAVVNAWYQPELNSITFPLGILASPYYRPDFPQALNYGGQGATAGHELTHGFDDEGVQFFSNGTLQNWMSQQSKQGFQKMAQCVINQYSQYCYPRLGNLCINGKTTQGENIADIGGLRAAYYAYKAYVAKKGPEPLLPGLEKLSMDQIFFIAYGRGWCSQQTDSRLINQLVTNVHSPAKWRVNGVLADIPEFASAFQCKVGSDPMAPAPAQRCTVW